MCTIFGPKIRLCKFFDKSQVWAMMFKLQTLQSKQLLQAEGGEGQGEDDVLAIDLVVQGPEETPEEGRLEGKEDRVHRQGGQGVGGEEQQVRSVVELPAFEELGWNIRSHHHHLSK